MTTEAATFKSDEPQYTERLAIVTARTEIERKATDLVVAIEYLGGHPDLTMAQSLVMRARNWLGHWHDQGEPGRAAFSPEPAPIPADAAEPDPIPEVFEANIMGGILAGDVVVVTTPDHLNIESAAILKGMVQEAMPAGVKVLLLDAGASATVLRPSARPLDGEELFELFFTMFRGGVPPELDAKGCARLANDIARIQLLSSPQVPKAALEPAPAPKAAPAKLPGVYVTDGEGEPWAVVFEGDWTPEEVTRDMAWEIINQTDPDAAIAYAEGDLTAGYYFLTTVSPFDRDVPDRKKRDDDDAGEFEPAMWFCNEGEEGAYRVVAVKLT